MQRHRRSSHYPLHRRGNPDHQGRRLLRQRHQIRRRESQGKLLIDQIDPTLNRGDEGLITHL